MNIMNRKIGIFAITFINILLLVACANNDREMNTVARATLAPTIAPTDAPTVAPTQPPTQAPTANANPFEVVNFYYNDRSQGKRTLVEGYNGAFTKGKDIVSYDVFVTDEAFVATGYFKDVWDKYWNKYTETDGFKIGYELEFLATDGKNVSTNILSPKDTEDFFEYVEVYLYDDTNKLRGQWYSHILEEEMNDSTILSSIKLTAGQKIECVSKIKLTVFVYKDAHDFDALTGKYIGDCKKTIYVNRVQ